VEGLEVIQSIQTAANDVRLIIGKRTFVRAYLSSGELPMDQLIAGKLSCRHGGRNIEVNCTTPLLFLDFDSDGNNCTEKLAFWRSPQLHCKTVGFRVAHPGLGGHLEPSTAEISFEALQENLDYTRENNETVERQLSNLLCQLLAIRNEDVMAGQDPRTLYLGVLPDPTARYGGIAMDSPDHVAPHIVSLCSVESSGELAAHELAHVLGRHHPGVPDVQEVGRPLGQNNEYRHGHGSEEIAEHSACYDNGADDPPLQTGRDRDGYIATLCDLKGAELASPDYGIMGLDTRNNTSQPQILPGRQYFDLMTYRYPKWVSRHTYDELYVRLIEFDRALPDLRASENANDRDHWTVIARYDLCEHSGSIEHVLKTNYKAPESTRESKPASALSLPPIHSHADEGSQGKSRPSIQFEWGGDTAPQSGYVEPGKLEDRPVSNYMPNSASSGLSQTFGLIHHSISSQTEDARVANQGQKDDLSFVRLMINDVAISEFADKRNTDKRNEPNDRLIDDPFAAIKASIYHALRATLPDLTDPDDDVQDGVNVDPRLSRIAGVDDSELVANLTYDDEPRLLVPGIRVTWSASSGQSYFHFNWPRQRSRITTTVQCKRQPVKWPAIGGRDANARKPFDWETIAVTDEQNCRVWVDPRFFGYPGYGDDSGLRDLSIGMNQRVKDGLTLRVFAHVGFERICVFNNDHDDWDTLDAQEHRRTADHSGPETTVDGGLLKPVIRDTATWLREKREHVFVMPVRPVSDVDAAYSKNQAS